MRNARYRSASRTGLATVLVAAVLIAALLVTAVPAAAELPPQPSQCAFTAVLGSLGGAAGSEIFGVTLKPAVPTQQCSAQVDVTVAITTSSGAPAGGVTDNPVSAAVKVSFVPSQLPPVVVFGWSGYCTAGGGAVDVVAQVGGASAVLGLGASESCSAKGLPSSALLAESSTTSQISAVGLVPTPGGGGYRIANQVGFVSDEGNAAFLVTEPDSVAPVVAIAAAHSGDGVWLATSTGGVFSYGSAAFHGSAGSQHLNAPIVGMAADPATGGYWLVASDGGVFSYGAPFYGSAGGIHLNAPVVGMASTPDGGGYWLVAADGGVFSYGDAKFYGSAGAEPLNAPIAGMAADPAGGYWLVATDGGVFSYGAPFHGSAGGEVLNAPVASMTSTPDGGGYWLVGADGGVFTYGDAPFFGSAVP